MVKKKEAHTDLWVYKLLVAENIHLDPQGSTVKEIDEVIEAYRRS